jgi:hypothetical protein
MLACTVDLALRGSADLVGKADRYGKRTKTLMVVLSIVLFCAIGVFIAQVGWAVFISYATVRPIDFAPESGSIRER